ncbi:hypothetical protein AVEN_140558-1 [Araneus ventricosus]|uniref:DUF7041 domain-containing protein n=1 Tax=Araneus ventricosus TaxID=182803 RepID=A0A4Y2IS09_ARAVE|nr:hypothetical protein AVEN_140558-1 [Araneus ventricosus]
MNNSSDSSDGKSVSHFEVSRMAVKVPPFWRENPAIWFSQLESQFITSGIVQNSTKYHTVVASVETEILSQVSDIITSPPNNDMYKTLKERLINIFSDSEECRLKKLLQDVELGDKRPSMLSRQDLAGNRVGDELLRSLWLQRLLTQMQAILTTSSDDLNKLSIMADKIADVTSGSEICSNHVKTKVQETNIPNDCISNLQAQISELSLKIDRMSLFRRSRTDVSRPILGADFVTHYGIIIDLKPKSLKDQQTNLTSTGKISTNNTPSITALKLSLNFNDLIREYNDIFDDVERSPIKVQSHNVNHCGVPETANSHETRHPKSLSKTRSERKPRS